MLMGKYAKEIWNLYPKSRIRVDVTQAGASTYCIKLTLLNVHLKPILVFEHCGTGNLKSLKKEAVCLLAQCCLVPTGYI
jgi:hypothetical protein